MPNVCLLTPKKRPFFHFFPFHAKKAEQKTEQNPNAPKTQFSILPTTEFSLPKTQFSTLPTTEFSLPKTQFSTLPTTKFSLPKTQFSTTHRTTPQAKHAQFPTYPSAAAPPAFSIPSRRPNRQKRARFFFFFL
jgi:hypothetical protein